MAAAALASLPSGSSAWPFPAREALDRALKGCRRAFLAIALFSLAVNALTLAPSIFMLQVYDRVLTTGHLETLVMLTVITGVALAILGALDAVRTALGARAATWFADRVSPAALSYGVAGRLNGDGGGAQALRDLGTVQSFLSSQALGAFFDAPWVPVYVFIIWLLHPWLGVLAAVSALLLLLLGFVNEWVTRGPVLTANVKGIEALHRAEAIIRNAEVVRAMGMAPALEARWRALQGEGLLASQRAVARGGAVTGAAKFLRMFVQVAVLALGAYLVIRAELTSGGMIAGSILLGRALAPVEQAIGAWRQFASARIAFGRLRVRFRAMPRETERILLPEPIGRVSVSDLTATPPGGREPALRAASFAIEPGEAVAVIGPSASGKSTLCRVLVGTAPHSSGRVRLDGAELRHWDAEQLGRAIGYLPQDVELFAGTVAENIARMGAVDDVAVIRAATLAHAHEMIQRLPDGYETQIGDGGARLSGGQRQRIGLARAVYGEPCLVVLDEPNANLDGVGEAALAAALRTLKARGAALLIVGHRPSTLAEADKILFLREGRVELFGPREEVIRKLRGGVPAAPGEGRAPADGDDGAARTAISDDASTDGARPAAARLRPRSRGPGPAADAPLRLEATA